MPDQELYGQLELWAPEIEKYLHFERVAVKPIRPHTNTPTAPAGLRGVTLFDRRYPFSLNRRLGIPCLLQTVPSIAQPAPPGIENFKDFCRFLNATWTIDNCDTIPTPPWQENLFDL
jgi:hypothetical protein